METALIHAKILIDSEAWRSSMFMTSVTDDNRALNGISVFVRSVDGGFRFGSKGLIVYNDRLRRFLLED
jgi:hypothetical protein